MVTLSDAAPNGLRHLQNRSASDKDGSEASVVVSIGDDGRWVVEVGT